MNNELTKELAKKICKDLGATPISFQKAGVTHKDLLTEKIINISTFREDGQEIVLQNKVWYGEAIGGQGITCCLLSISDKPSSVNKEEDIFDIYLIIGFKDINGKVLSDSFCFGLSYDYSNEDGNFFLKIKDKWTEATIGQKLQLTLGLETFVQEGVIWTNGNFPNELWDALRELIELDSLG